MPSDRRRVLQLLSAAGGVFASSALAGSSEPSATKPGVNDHDMSHLPASWTQPTQVAMLLYPGMTALDYVGPHFFLGGLMGATVYQVAKTKAAIVSDTGLNLVPTATFDEAPVDLDVLLVPGGSDGTLTALEDTATVDFIADRGSRAKWVASVCTGALILGQAGLLRGYRATTHWVAHDLLKTFGAEPVDQRVVRDRNRLTAAGVSAGLDLGLTLTAELRDRSYAQTMQLIAEYAPEPPFDAGSPKNAPKDVVKMTSDMFTGFRKRLLLDAKNSR